MPYLEQKLQPRLSQRLIITPALRQAIQLLQLSKLDLEQEISTQLVENPALEDQGSSNEVSLDAKTNADGEPSTGPEAEGGGELEEFASMYRDLEDSYRPMNGMTERRSPEDMPTMEQMLRSERHLSDHLSWQLEMSSFSPKVAAIGEALIGNIDERGYLEATAEEIAEMAPEGKSWTSAEVERVRRLIQEFDPLGVGSRDLRECLLVQLELGGHADDVAMRIVRDHLGLLEQQRFDELQAVLDVSDDELDEALEVIRHLDPRPGEKYRPEQTTYITPDVYVIKDGDDYRVLLNEDGLPRLRISPAYSRMLASLAAGSENADPNAREFVREKVRSAIRLIRSLDERQRTIKKVANSIIKFQRPFLDRGLEEIRPLVLRDVADDIGMHESTVSRVVNQKYMHTPRGLFEMRFFFHSGLASSGGESISSLTVKERIKRLVADEPEGKPLSDQAIAEELRKEGLQIARRTVAKYREELRIPPSTQRRRQRSFRRNSG